MWFSTLKLTWRFLVWWFFPQLWLGKLIHIIRYERNKRFFYSRNARVIHKCFGPREVWEVSKTDPRGHSVDGPRRFNVCGCSPPPCGATVQRSKCKGVRWRPGTNTRTSTAAELRYTSAVKTPADRLNRVVRSGTFADRRRNHCFPSGCLCANRTRRWSPQNFGPVRYHTQSRRKPKCRLFHATRDNRKKISFADKNMEQSHVLDSNAIC